MCVSVSERERIREGVSSSLSLCLWIIKSHCRLEKSVFLLIKKKRFEELKTHTCSVNQKEM